MVLIACFDNLRDFFWAGLTMVADASRFIIALLETMVVNFVRGYEEDVAEEESLAGLQF